MKSPWRSTTFRAQLSFLVFSLETDFPATFGILYGLRMLSELEFMFMFTQQSVDVSRAFISVKLWELHRYGTFSCCLYILNIFWNWKINRKCWQRRKPWNQAGGGTGNMKNRFRLRISKSTIYQNDIVVTTAVLWNFVNRWMLWGKEYSPVYKKPNCGAFHQSGNFFKKKQKILMISFGKSYFKDTFFNRLPCYLKLLMLSKDTRVCVPSRKVNIYSIKVHSNIYGNSLDYYAKLFWLWCEHFRRPIQTHAYKSDSKDENFILFIYLFISKSCKPWPETYICMHTV